MAEARHCEHKDAFHVGFGAGAWCPDCGALWETAKGWWVIPHGLPAVEQGEAVAGEWPCICDGAHSCAWCFMKEAILQKAGTNGLAMVVGRFTPPVVPQSGICVPSDDSETCGKPLVCCNPDEHPLSCHCSLYGRTLTPVPQGVVEQMREALDEADTMLMDHSERPDIPKCPACAAARVKTQAALDAYDKARGRG